MIQSAELTRPSAPTLTGRPIKFTPERIQQIKNLVERGKSREEIAEIIGVSLGSLQVTCSRLGISLRRRPVFNVGTGLLRRDARGNNDTTTQPLIQDSSSPSRPEEQHHEQNSPGPVEQIQGAARREERSVKMHQEGPAPFAIRMQYKGEVRISELHLTQDAIAHLALAAEFRNMTIGELIAKMIVAIAERDDLCQAVLAAQDNPCTPCRESRHS